MYWEKQQALHPQLAQLNASGGGGMFVKVMTDEQMEVLRKQIAVYATICEQLVDLHKSTTSHHDPAVMNVTLLTCGGHKITGRQRWTPTPVQLQLLEQIFEKGTGTPSKQRIREMTTELSQHGRISETNVYNWFQNRRARSKRKHHAPTPNNAESEVETEVEWPNEKKTKPEDLQSPHILTTQQQNPETMKTSKPEPVMQSQGNSKPDESYNQMSFYERVDHLHGKMEVRGSYNPYLQKEDCNMNMTD